MCTNHWQQPMTDFLVKTRDLLRNMLMARIGENFGQYRETALWDEVCNVVNAFLDKAYNEECLSAERTLRLENTKPFTRNFAALKEAEQRELKILMTKRREIRVQDFLDEQEELGKKRTAADKVTEEDIGGDQFQQEIQTLASVRGYYECAYTRFVDNVCQSIQAELFLKCREGISSALEEHLGIMKPDGKSSITQALCVPSSVCMPCSRCRACRQKAQKYVHVVCDIQKSHH